VVWLQGLNTGAWEAKLFQASDLLIFVAVPAVGIVRCTVEAESRDLCEQNTRNFYRGPERDLLWAPLAKEGKQMRLQRNCVPLLAAQAQLSAKPKGGRPMTTNKVVSLAYERQLERAASRGARRARCHDFPG
jgi:hypothetical protein